MLVSPHVFCLFFSLNPDFPKISFSSWVLGRGVGGENGSMEKFVVMELCKAKICTGSNFEEKYPDVISIIKASVNLFKSLARWHTSPPPHLPGAWYTNSTRVGNKRWVRFTMVDSGSLLMLCLCDVWALIISLVCLSTNSLVWCCLSANYLPLFLDWTLEFMQMAVLLMKFFIILLCKPYFLLWVQQFTSVSTCPSFDFVSANGDTEKFKAARKRADWEKILRRLNLRAHEDLDPITWAVVFHLLWVCCFFNYFLFSLFLPTPSPLLPMNLLVVDVV